MQVEYERSGCKQFFKKHRNETVVIKKCIADALAVQVATGMSKVKRAASERVNGCCVYECRINLKKTGSARVAFIAKDDKITVLFISATLQKDSFTHLLERELKEEY
ncbi:hypothetical protein PT285_09310 [Lactobacillus sp. ESL0791]|uniref:hypothetical protein n=1 Tax=Lactobacillus sp. ESL0791 TaxID=2983234 RepID=UPI0023F77004|nr:hypothetical protein [Lactobacillus sp. ESL0791]MDF7639596.1 hypothetical protein [Lactobacillus sp. ESL0791]